MSITRAPCSYAAAATQQASSLGQNANDWGKKQWGVDVGGQVGGLVDTVRTAAVGNRPPAGYSHVDHNDDETSALYSDAGDDDFFSKHDGTRAGASASGAAYGATSSSSAPAPAPAAAKAKKTDEWEDW